MNSCLLRLPSCPATSFASLLLPLALASGAFIPLTTSAQAPAATPTPASSPAMSVDDWQRQAVKDFPGIGTQGSEMNMKFVQRYKDLKASDPAFFNDPKWPYLIAQQIAVPAQIIPGVEAENSKTPAVNPDVQKKEEERRRVERSKISLQILTLNGQVREVKSRMDNVSQRISSASQDTRVYKGRRIGDHGSTREMQGDLDDLQKKLDGLYAQIKVLQAKLDAL